MKFADVDIGVYFDFALNGTATVLLSLHNSEQDLQTITIRATKTSPSLDSIPVTNRSSAKPISLLARVDDDEYIVLPSATSIVSIRRGNLDPFSRHEIRIIAPMVGGDAGDTLQVEGIWIDEKGRLLPYKGHSDDDRTIASVDSTSLHLASKTSQRKMLEIVTDIPGSMAGTDSQKNAGTTRGILSGVMGWEYLLGEMFGTDHVTIGMDGMCLIPECIGGSGSPAGLADVFFQSGPVGSDQYAQPWLFQEYVPNVIVRSIHPTQSWNTKH